MKIIVEEVGFNTILPIWITKLWPHRASAIEPASSMLYLGDYDIGIKHTHTPRFFVVKGDNDIIGVNSGHQTSDVLYRSRGIYVDPSFNQRGIGRMLIAAVEEAAQEVGCGLLWSVPRRSALPFYLKCGFVQTSDFFEKDMEFGPNCYALKSL